MKTLGAVLTEMGRPTPYSRSKPIEVQELDLEPPGPGEVLVSVAAAGLCHSDLSVINGTRPRPVPMVLGHEASGIVREIGAHVSDVLPGDHVVFSFVPVCGRCLPCASGRPALCERGGAANTQGTLLGGGRRLKDRGGRAINHHCGVSAFCQHAVVAQESLVKIDPTFPLDKAALFGCAVVTGVGAVVNTAKVPPGASVAVFGLGGVGLCAIAGARMAGANPIVAVDLAAHKLEYARRLGASHVVDAGREDAVAAVKAATRGGAQFAFDAAGHEKALMDAYAATARGGTTVAIGLPPPTKQFSISALSIVAEERAIVGSYMGSAVPRRDIPRFIDLYRAGHLPIDSLMTGTIPLSDINGAFDELDRTSAVRQILTF